MSQNPLAEVFGFPVSNHSNEAKRYRKGKLCPFNNKVPNCTKDKALDPLGVCSIFDESGNATITCPVRFREDWMIAEDAAAFFFPVEATWTSLTEVRLKDGYGQSAGNIDIVLVSYDERGRLLDFGSLESTCRPPGKLCTVVAGKAQRPATCSRCAEPARYFGRQG